MNSTKDNILQAVNLNKPAGEYLYPQIPVFAKSTKNILDEFKENLDLAAGTWHNVKDANEAMELIKELHPDAKVICSAAPEIKGNRDIHKITDPHQLDDVDVGVVRAEFGVSESGMILLSEDDLVVDALGFLSQHIIILLKPDQLVRDMHEAYARVSLDKNNYACFMLGPSATADIGAVMVRGAQGARTLSVFFM